MMAFLGFDNIADVNYSSYGLDYGIFGNYYYPMPGRTFKAGLSFIF
jgi:outer membrane receptor protein involved in Fe transport